MNQLIEKIKNIFGRKGKLETAESRKDKSLNDAVHGTSDVARSIRESKKFQTQKKLWRNVFHF